MTNKDGHPELEPLKLGETALRIKSRQTMAFKRKMQIRNTPVEGIMAESSSDEEEIVVKEP